MSTDSTDSPYLDHLPDVFRQDPFIGRFLRAFSTVLSTGTEQTPETAAVTGIAQTIDGLADYIDPVTAPPEFLPWLSGWVALTLRADWSTATQRRFLQEVVALYRLRGTAAGLKRMLMIYLGTEQGEDVEIIDDLDGPAHYFQVRLRLRDADPQVVRQTQQVAEAIIEQEKPAHTFYGLRIQIPTMRLVSEELQAEEGGLPPLLILGENTILGTSSWQRGS